MDHIDKALKKAQRERTSVRSWVKPNRGSAEANLVASEVVRPLEGRPVTFDEETLRSNSIICDPDYALAANVDVYRRLRTLVLQSMKARGWNKLGITSPGAKAGKTLNAINLAMAIAREGSRSVLLIDADFRRPAVADSLGIEVDSGLLDYIAGEVQLADLVLTPTNVKNLSIIPGRIGDSSSATPELIGSARMDDVLSSLGRQVRNSIVIVDLPPTLIGDDVIALAPRLDALLLVVAEGITDVEDLRKTAELLEPFELVGTILNNSRQKDATFEGYYHTVAE